jgi:hypothetical protein
MPAKSINNYLYSPYFLSFIMALVVIVLLPPMFSRYRVEVAGEGRARYVDEQEAFADIDGDGNSDRIASFTAPQGFHCIQVFDHEGGVIDQWNFNGIVPGSKDRMLAGDYDGDGEQEVFAFCQDNDTLYLYGFHPREQEGFFIDHQFITPLARVDGKLEYVIPDISLADLDDDGFKDLVFLVAAGFSIAPRKIFCYNIRSGTLTSSPASASVIGKLTIVDLDADGHPEIFGQNGSGGNVPDSLGLPFTDYSAWLMVFNHTLDYAFPPVEFPGFHSQVSTLPFYSGDNAGILALYNHTGSRENIPELRVHDHLGKLLYQRTFPRSPKYQALLVQDGKDAWMAIDRGRLYRIADDLQFADSVDLGTTINMGYVQFDMDGDGARETIFTKKGANGGVILRQGMKYPVLIDYPADTGKGSPVTMALQASAGNPPVLYVKKGDHFRLYAYGRNPMHLMRFPVYLGVYLIILVLVLLVRKIQRLQIRDKLRLQDRISELQMKTINNQLDPHFTFNAFNSIASLLKKEKGDNAYSYFIKFSNLVRSNLMSADRIARSLSEELDLVRNYLDLQLLRFAGRFEYAIMVDPGVNEEWMIPKMTIQNYVENAVNHGLKEREQGGRLEVTIRLEEKTICIEITDNGLGRAKAAERGSESTGLGMGLMNQYFSLLNTYNSVKIRQEVEDLYHPDGKPAGTRVRVEVPVQINYNIAKYV